MSSKHRPSRREAIPVHLRGKGKRIDPRFDEHFGEYNAKEFRQSYHFITDMRREELKVDFQLNKTLPIYFSLLLSRRIRL